MYYSDDPINDPGEDRLERAGFVEQLENSILGWKSSQSLVLALYGSWGTGKSSILNLLKQRLSKGQTNVAIANFDPWFFNSADQLLKGFWEVFTDTSDPILANAGRKHNKLKKLTRKYSKSLSFAPELSLGVLKFSLPVNTGFEDPQSIKNEIEGLLQLAKGKAVFLIDNLDRLDAQELILILKLIRLCSDLPNTIYVLAFDKAQVEKILAERSDIDADYLDKIIQVDVNLPYADGSKIEEIFVEGLDQVLHEHQARLEEEFKDRFSLLFQRQIRPQLLIDIRRTKRYLNGISFNLPLVKEEVNYTDLILLEFIRVFSPSVYALIPNYKAELIAFDSGLIGGDDYQRRGKHQKFVALIKEIDSKAKNPDCIKAILGELFPVFGAYLSNPNNPTYITRDYLGQEYDRKLRIASNRHFDKYFRLQVPSSEIPIAVVRNQIERVNTLAEEQATGQIAEIVRSLLIEGILFEMLERLSVFAEEISLAGKKMFIQKLAEVSDQFDWAPKGIWSMPSPQSVVQFIDSCLEQELDFQAVNDVLGCVARESRSLSFACYFASRISSRAAQRWAVASRYNKSELTAIIADRIEHEVLESQSDLFQEYPDSNHYIFGFWKSPDFVNLGEKAQGYFYKLLKKHPSYIPTLLTRFLWTLAGTDEPTDLDFVKLREAYDVEMLHSLITKAGVNAGEDLKATFALNQFIRLYDEMGHDAA